LRAGLLELVASLGVEAVEIRIHGNEPCAAETKKSITVHYGRAKQKE
jgi:hypothetical protein